MSYSMDFCGVPSATPTPSGTRRKSCRGFQGIWRVKWWNAGAMMCRTAMSLSRCGAEEDEENFVFS